MKYLAIVAYLLSATAALAHGGHEKAWAEGDVHWLTSADHLVLLVLGAVAAGIVIHAALRFVRRVLVRS